MVRAQHIFVTKRLDETLLIMPQSETAGFSDADLQRALQKVLKQLDKPGVENLVVDLGGKNYFGSAMIGAIFQLRMQARQTGGRAALCNASEEMLDVLRILKMGSEWPYFASRDEALASIEA